MRLPALTYSNVVASIALFVALGGTSYAVARNSVGTAQLRNDAVTSAKVRDGSLTGSDLAPGSLLAGARGPRGPEGPAGPRGPSDARFATPPGVALSRSQSVPVEVASLQNVAAGSYLVVFTGEATMRNTSGIYVVCEIRVNGTSISASRGIVGDTYGGSEALADVIPVTRTAPFDLSVACYPDQSTGTLPSGPSVNLQKLVALRVDSVTKG